MNSIFIIEKPSFSIIKIRVVALLILLCKINKLLTIFIISRIKDSRDNKLFSRLN